MKKTKKPNKPVFMNKSLTETSSKVIKRAKETEIELERRLEKEWLKAGNKIEKFDKPFD